MDCGAKIHLVQATLGDTDISITGRYLHARPNDSSALYLGSSGASLFTDQLPAPGQLRVRNR